MAPVAQHLSDTQVAVLDRRARARRQSRAEYVRDALTELARKRCADDTIVEFLREQGRVDSVPESDAARLHREFGLPLDAVEVFGSRAQAVGTSLPAYVDQELVRLARCGTVEDALLEMREAQQRDPSLRIDLDAVAASVRFARGE